ncbi:MAG: chromosome segregation protein SMC [Dehalococcoidia bacterium]|nr:chromosome segregation protein SMC [Dehalococcoidia bacterium]
MYLKRLDVQGFKSFGNKTTLEFGTGVTCIVGPNGCGKTNVADSLRWVLGEHASRTLRARKTEDVIFAGSDKRAPMGVAEVSIALDNSGQWLPIDFGEVVVTRRAYRNGENEYFINNARVRLRDVVDLFLRAQVGQNSYAFMGQGMVEQVLSLRPEDRRALIEEAADVRLHRTRLEEAQGKLKGTRENLERVYLLVREIEPRITQLERQAGRAVKYQELARELASTLHVWYAHQWQEVNEQLLAAMAAFDQRTEEFERLRAAVQADESALAQLRAAIDERRHEISVRDERLRMLEDYARDLERRAALDAERGTLLAERIDELTGELATLRDDEAAQAATVPQPLDTGDREAALAEARQALATTRASLAEVEQELLRAQRAVLTHEQTAAGERRAADAHARAIAEREERSMRLRRDAEAQSAERATVIGELAASARNYRRVLADGVALVPRIDEVLAERAALAGAIDRGRRERATAEDEVRELRAQADALQMRLEMMETLDAQPQTPDAGIRMILEAGGVLKRESVPDDIELRGVLGLVGQIVKVPGGLEKAIEAALADSLFAIVLQRQADVRPVLDFLLTGEAGRATLYALDEMQEVRPLHLIKERGVLGVASQLVRCEGKYRRLIDTLLGRTVVVEDLPLAQRIIKRGMASAVATLDGVLLRPVGSIAAGTMPAVQASFVREREVDDIPRQLAELRSRLDERDMALAAVVAELDASQARHDALGARVEALRSQRAASLTELAAATGDLASFRSRMHTLRAAAAATVDELARLGASLASAWQDRGRADAAATDAAGREQAERQAVIALESRRAALRDAMGEQAAAVAQLEGELRNERQAGEGDRIARERIVRQLAAKQSQQAKIIEEAQTIATRLGATRRELAAKGEEIGALHSELEPARSEHAQLASRERALTAELADANARMRAAERTLFEAENDVRIRRDELDALRASLEAEGFVATTEGEVERLPEPEPAFEIAGDGEHADRSDDHDGPDGLPGWMRDADGGLPPIRGGATINPTEVRDRIAELRAQIRALGPVNEQAATDYSESRERYDFLTGQLDDLREAEAQLQDAIGELEGVIRERFRSTFRVVNREFERYFSAFFRGGTARLELGETDEDGLPGIEIVAQPPGKKLGSLALLSGGERSLTAVALLFALLQANPSPICVLDEVDAALDEANVGRFVEELRELSKRTQFIIITHNRRTIETADTIYGVSMGADSVTRVLSLRLADVKVAED